MEREILEHLEQELQLSNDERFVDNDHTRSYLGMSGIGEECWRKLWYDFRHYDTPDISNRISRLFNLGNIIEEEIIKALEVIGLNVIERQRELSDESLDSLFIGHIDGCIDNLEDYKILLECKSTNKKYFDVIKKKGVKLFPYFKKYYAQVQCYMGYGGYADCIMAFYCKDNSEIKLESVPFSENAFEALKRKARAVITANEAPVGFTENPDIALGCKWCDFRAICLLNDFSHPTLKICRNCRFLEFKSIEQHCCHSNHPYQILDSMRSCKDWQYKQI